MTSNVYRGRVEFRVGNRALAQAAHGDTQTAVAEEERERTPREHSGNFPQISNPNSGCVRECLWRTRVRRRRLNQLEMARSRDCRRFKLIPVRFGKTAIGPEADRPRQAAVFRGADDFEAWK